MTKTISEIKQIFEREQKFAEEIMDGGEGYDGADGARVVLELCECFNQLIEQKD
jgi:hypothetical protein